MELNIVNHRDTLLRQSRDKLKRKCKALKVSGEGSKTNMIDRIIDAMQQRNILNHNQHQLNNQHVIPLNTHRLRLQRRLHYKPPDVRIIKQKTPKNTSNINVIHNHKIKKAFKKNYLTFNFVGIRPPRSYRYKDTTSSNIDDIKIKSLMIKSRLVSNSSIAQLKSFIKGIYSIPLKHDILILYSHIIISTNNDAQLKHYGITDHSLLLIAVCKGKTRSNYDRYSHQYLFRSLKYLKQHLIDSDGIQKGLDVITQETDVTVYKMPICRHLMSRQSLFDYAMSFFMNECNVYLRCPHTKDDDAKYDDWSCPHCTYVNSNSNSSSSSSRQCAMCGHTKPQNISFATNQCNAIWHYALIKQILLDSHDGYGAVDVNKLELLSARNKLMNDKSLNVQKCFVCKTLYFKNSKQPSTVSNIKCYKIFRSKCIFCCNLFCWNCGKKCRSNHECDGSSRLQIINLLKTCLTKTIGNVSNVPSIRCCPNINCAQMITHLAACKHIKCGSCSTSFCFVCMKPKLNGRWQCGGSSDRCNIAPRQTLHLFNKNKTIVIDFKKTFQLLD